MAPKSKILTRTPDEQRDADEQIKDVRSKTVGWFSGTTELREQIAEDFRFTTGGRDQWLADDISKLTEEKRPIQTFNVVSPIVNFLAGYQYEREQDYRMFPRGAEDEQLGRLLTSQTKYAMDQSNGCDQHHLLFRKGATCGRSVIEVAHSFEFTDDILEGDITQVVLPENSYAHEIGARRYDLNDASWFQKFMWITPDEGKRRWKQHAQAFSRMGFRDWLGQDSATTGVPSQYQLEFFDEKTGRIRILQHWYRVPQEVTLIVNTQTGEVQRMEDETEADKFIKSIRDSAGAQAAAPFLIEKAKSQSALINQQTGVIHTYRKPEHAMAALELVKQQAGQQATKQFELVTRPTTTLRVSHLTGWELLDDLPSPYGADWRFPFVPFTCYQDTDDFRSIKGVVRDIKDAQREINWHHSTMLDAILRGPKGGTWLPSGSGVDIQKLKREISRNGFIGEFAGNQPPVTVPAPVINGADMTMLQFGLDFIMRQTGINADLMGQNTQKTISGRAIQARQSGGLVGVGTIFANWKRTKKLIGELLVRRIQQFYSPEKMDRIVGQDQRIAQAMGFLGGPVIPDAVMFENFTKLKNIDVDVVVDFQDPSPSARGANVAQMMQMMAAGFPVPPQFILEASDVPYKEEIKAALSKQGMSPPNEALAKVVGAGQGQQASPNGVNTSQ